ncbi:MAG TPA: beta-ketoacyl-ACP synthase II [Candidatus Nanopelagicales bacterium]|nr:beta-ketoacyl-ACP synthase II [Candidatus Nanopelagicales bacterium]
MTQPRIVVTGLGASTPVGGDVASTWDGLLTGRSGIRTLEGEQYADLPVRIAGQAAVDPGDVLPRPEARKLDRSQQFALVAAREAWADAGSPDVDPMRLGVALASGIGGIVSLLEQNEVLKERGWTRVSPMSVPMLMPNGAAAWVGLDIGAKAGIHAPVSACASGAEAVWVGYEMVRSGRADVVLVGGTEACTHPITIAAFAAMRALSTRNDEPHRASRPYDKGRDGFVMGEGAGCLVLETLEHAQARGATVYAEVAGIGITSDGHHIAQPDPTGSGAARAMTAAIESAGVTPSDIVHVNAHATSTPQGDVAEAGAIRSVLGAAADGVAVSGTKSMTGHLLGGAGAVESVAAVLALHHRLAPVTANVDDLDDEVQLDVVTREPRPRPEGDIAVLNNSFGFGGHNVALVFRSV